MLLQCKYALKNSQCATGRRNIAKAGAMGKCNIRSPDSAWEITGEDVTLEQVLKSSNMEGGEFCLVV